MTGESDPFMLASMQEFVRWILVLAIVLIPAAIVIGLIYRCHAVSRSSAGALASIPRRSAAGSAGESIGAESFYRSARAPIAIG